MSEWPHSASEEEKAVSVYGRSLSIAVLAVFCGLGACQQATQLPRYTAKSLPAASAHAEDTVQITDGASGSDCTTGDGTYTVLCTAKAGVWVAGVASMGPSINSAALLSSLRPWIDVASPAYGADPTGATPSDKAISSAVTAAIASDGCVYFSPGTYLINSGILWKQSRSERVCVISHGATLRAGADGITVLAVNGVNRYERGVIVQGPLFIDLNGHNSVGLSVNASNYIGWVDFVQIGGASNASMEPLMKAQGTLLYITNCVFDGWGFKAASSSSTVPAGVLVPSRSDVLHLEGNAFKNFPNGAGIAWAAADTGNNITLVGNTFEILKYGVYTGLSKGIALSGFMSSHNHFEACSAACLYLKGVSQVYPVTGWSSELDTFSISAGGVGIFAESTSGGAIRNDAFYNSSGSTGGTTVQLNGSNVNLRLENNSVDAKASPAIVMTPAGNAPLPDAGITTTQSTVDTLQVVQDSSTGSRPACTAAQRGRYFVEKGTGAGGADQVLVCKQAGSSPAALAWFNLESTQGTGVVYRCTQQGNLPVGALTVNAASCGASTDTGLRAQ